MEVTREKKLDYVMNAYANALSNPDLTKKFCENIEKYGIDESLFMRVAEIVLDRVEVAERILETDKRLFGDSTIPGLEALL